MKNKSLFALASVVVTIGLASCNLNFGGGNLAESPSLSKNDAYEMQQTLMGGQSLDISRVYTARMLVNGARVDVTSLAPEVLALEGKEQSRAATVLTFDAERKNVIFFTRDPETGQGFLRNVAVLDLAKKPAFDFPMVVGNTITNGRFEVIDLTMLP